MAEIKDVLVDHLKDNMQITAFTKFAQSYTNMEEQICNFVQRNFNDSSVEVLRNGKITICTAKAVKVDDTLKKIFNLPASLSKLTNVGIRLPLELKRRGFLEFTVQVSEKQISSRQENHLHSVREANELIHKIKESVKKREEATDAAKDILEGARRKKPQAKEVIENIDSVMSQTSSEAMAAIALLQNSDQTYAHCVDAAAIFQTVYFAIKEKKKEKPIFDEKMANFGAFMHDFGKAKVPKEVLESTDRFERNSKEMQLIMSHPTYGADLLGSMDMPDYIINMAHYHHVKMDPSLNSSYPSKVNYDDVLMETRLVSIVDVYQALIGRRSYKKLWAPAAAIRYLDALSGSEFDPDIWEEFVEAIGLYPKGSLVELSDQTIGFVMSVPQEDLERPEVVIFRDSSGNDLGHPQLIDLQEEEDLEIYQYLNHYEVLGENALEVFLGIEVS